MIPKGIVCPRCGGGGYIADPRKEGAEMRQHRQDRGISLTALAKQAGISAAYLSDLERGNRPWHDAIRRRVLEQLRHLKDTAAEPTDKGPQPQVGNGVVRRPSNAPEVTDDMLDAFWVKYQEIADNLRIENEGTLSSTNQELKQCIAAAITQVSKGNRLILSGGTLLPYHDPAGGPVA